MQPVLGAVKQQGWIHDWKVVSIQQNDFTEAGGIDGKGFQGIALDVGWLVMGWVGHSGGISAGDICKICLQVKSIV